MAGPLSNLRILEMAAIGPVPFCTMMLSDMGAEVIRIDRKSAAGTGAGESIVDRGRRSICLDLKTPEATDVVLRLVAQADVLLEGFRPGVMERLGLGPTECMQRNARLVYGRMTGWGQTGPLSQAAGHDLNYIAITGALHAMGYRDRPPTPPLHVFGDLGGGAMMMAFGVMSALWERERSGKGQVIDAAICEGASMLATGYHGRRATGQWVDQRQSNVLDGGAHFYGTYACADGKYLSVGAIEPQFYRQLLQLSGIADPDFHRQLEPEAWPALRDKLAAILLHRTRDEWCRLLEGSDACVAPVLDFEEATRHPQFVERKSFVRTGGVVHPAPTPRLSRTPGEARTVSKVGAHTQDVLRELGLTSEEIEALGRQGAI
ncbi:CaiB/BaiF CoA transferase family protein [Variovorax boronicumulans]|uniref:CaiB/BaiF CoA transferase family protein n=1 Tax=Variovorax boronicumulans TaxID=436515 RepID=UPI001C598256